MADNKRERLEAEVREMRLKEEDADVDMDTIAPANVAKREVSVPGSGAASASGTPRAHKRQSRSPMKRQMDADSPTVKSDHEETIGGDVVLKLEPGKPPKLARSTSHKVEKRPPQLFWEYDDKTREASATFDVLPECTYANKYLGTTESALECDCAEEWGKSFLKIFLCGIALQYMAL